MSRYTYDPTNGLQLVAGMPQIDASPTDGHTDVTVSSDGVYEDNKKTREITAPVEDGTTVAKANITGQSYAYAIGDQFIRNGVLYKATATISNGATWSAILSSYTTADDVSSQIEALANQLEDLQIAEYDSTDESIVFRSSDVATYDSTDESIIINI